MSYRATVLLGLVLAGSARAFDFPIQVTEYVDDVRVVAYIDEQDMETETPWHPFEAAPPLSVEQALKAVAGQIASDEALAGARLAEIVLRRIPHHESYWHYMVKLKTDAPTPHHTHYYLVLMSGKVIPALKRPPSIK
jgi:hypothetical protein